VNAANPEAVRQFHRSFATGVTVVTAMHEGQPRGLLVNAFSSVSLEPPVVLVCVANQAATAPALLGTSHIAVNTLAADQEEIARRFAVSGGDKFAGLDWQPGQTGAPILAGTAAHLEAEIEQRIPAYTHTIFLARVVTASAHGRDPMIYLDGQFFSAATLG
jgi:flavin reductase (DIM6/NTAB) family NADH-FMN oxidoreductase RutF